MAFAPNIRKRAPNIIVLAPVTIFENYIWNVNKGSGNEIKKIYFLISVKK